MNIKMNMDEKYDFILFENLQGAIHHYKDLCIIGNMLKTIGYSVAIATLYDERKYCEGMGIEILDIKHKKKKPNNDWQQHPKNKIHSFYQTLKYLYQQYRYIKDFLIAIRPLSSNIYAGSYHNFTSALLIKEAVPNRKVIFWGLRTYRVSSFNTVFKLNVIAGLRLLFIKPMLLRNNDLCFFVSNEIIRKECIDIGIQENRLLIREERMCEEIPNKNNIFKSPKFCLLTIGLLRSDKQIELLIDSFKSISTANDTYVIAGRSSEKYRKIINLKIDNDNRIIRIDKYLDENIYHSLFESCHFVLFGDKKKASSITNGTLLEAFLHRRPVICPNYEPYSYYINKYNLGILYDSDSVESLNDALIRSKKLPIDYYDDYFDVFLETLKYSTLIEQFKMSVYKVLNTKVQ